MKVMIVNPIIAYMEGGAEVNDRSLAMALESMGHEVMVMGVRDDHRPGTVEIDREFLAVEMSYDYDEASRRGGLRGKMARNAFFHRFVRESIARHRDSLDSFDAILCTGKPVLARIRDHLSHARLGMSVRGRSRPWHHRWYRHADLVIYWGGCETEHPRRVVERVPHVCVSPAVDLVHARVSERSPDPAACRLAFVGRLDPVKQVDEIIRAVALLRKRGVPARLSIVGDGSIRADLQDLQASLDLQDSVEFKGRLDKEDVARVLGQADMMVMASRTENKPIAAMESVMLGTYVIAPRLGRLPDILKDARHGTIYDEVSAGNLAEAIAAAWEDRRFESAWTSPVPGWPTWADAAADIVGALYPGGSTP